MSDLINLVPADFHRRLTIRRRLRQWGSVCFILVVAVTCRAFSENDGLDSQRIRLQHLEAKVNTLQSAESELLLLQREFDGLSLRASLIEQLERWDHPAQLIGTVCQAGDGEQLDVHISSLHLAPIRTQVTREITLENGQRQTLIEPVDRMHLQLTGVGADDFSVARFVLNLRSNQHFDRVLLRSSADVPWAEANACEFHVECEYQ